MDKILLSFLALCALVKVGYSAPSCDASGVLPCLLPTISFALSPEGQKFTQLKDSGEITEPQLTSVCRLGKTTVTCLRDYVDRCVPQTVPDIHEFVRGTDGLMNVCNKPDLYTNTKILMTCNKKLNTTSPLFQRCHGGLQGAFKGLTGSVSDPTAALEVWQSGTMLRNVCCEMKKLRDCLGTEVNDKCGSDAARLDDTVYNALNNAYNCQTRTTACQA
jgi:hypothetical protein